MTTAAPSKPPPNGTAPKSPPPPPARSSAPTASKVAAPKWGKMEAKFQPPRIIVNAVEGWGKTSLIAHADKPLIIMASGETGYETLLGAGLVPSVDAAKIEAWPELLALIDELIATDTGHQTIGLDAGGGFERMCHQHACNRDFGGDWGERGFGSFQKGYDVSVNDWLQLLQRLDRLRDTHGCTIVMLSHCRVRPFKNPLGADFDRYVSDMHDKTWAVTAKWADDVLFGNFFTVVETKKGGAAESLKKGKGIGGTQRVVYTQRRDAYDAKNRHNLPECIDIPDDASQSWPTLWNLIAGENA